MKISINNRLLSLVLAGTLLLSFSLYLEKEHSFAEKIKSFFGTHLEKYPQEKVYLHLDKTFYKPGDDLWFKAYVVNAASHVSTDISDVLHVELINPKGNIEKSLELPVSEGWAMGDFHFDETVPGGLYKIRAYTQWMKNFDEAFFFEKEFQLQKVLYPRLLMKLDYNREAYGAGDEVIASLSLRSLDDEPLAGGAFNYQVSLDGSEFTQGQGKTNNEGDAELSFYLPKKLNSTDGLVNIMIHYEGNTESISRSVPIVLNHIDLQFFPEGGDMVADVPGRVAFKALNEFGKPADVEGIILSSQGDTVSTFRSFHQGMGAFNLKPASDIYRAVITRPKGIREEYELPEVLKKGYAIRVMQNPKKNLIEIGINSPRKELSTLVAHVRGNILYSKELKLSKGENKVKIRSENYPAGILQLTLFDSYQIPRCERLLFIHSDRKLLVKVESDKLKYQPREKVKLTISTYDQDSIPVPANLSLAVVNDKVLSFADDKQDNMLSWLLLNSDLGGEIYEPSFYFDPKEEKAEEALEYLLLTQGWRRFTWEEVLQPTQKLTFAPEKVTRITGTVVDKRSGKPVEAEVSLLEISGDRRIATVQTPINGRFEFLNVNPWVDSKILARKEGLQPANIEIRLDRTTSGSVSTASLRPSASELLPELIKQRPATLEKKLVAENNTNTLMAMEPNVTGLDEVVVVGYGTQKKSDVTGAITSVKAEELAPVENIEGMLQGRVAGVMVIQHANGLPGQGLNIRIRGVSTLDNTEPLFVIDGKPVAGTPDAETSPLSFLDPNEIESIEILKDISATAIYGTRGANGVIIINTKKNRFRGYSTIKQAKPRYCVEHVSARTFSLVREFYTPEYNSREKVEERTDFRSTIYWDPNVGTGKNGKAEVEFYNSDEITTFRATVEGMGPHGLIGRAETTWFSQLPFSIDTKIPPYLCFGDTANIAILLKNNTQEQLTGKLDLSIPDHLQVMEILPEEISIAAGEAHTLELKCRVGHMEGKSNLQISFETVSHRDAINQEIEVQAKGFPTELSVSGKEKEKTFAINISDPLKGSLKARFTAFPDITGDLLSGIESILREPYGCFEQTSSSTYPNILVLDYLKSTGTSNPIVHKKALHLIKKGYDRLVTFETPQRGYDWFGRAPAHEALTAYGIMEFTDMKRVYDGVSENMLQRTIKWLDSRRDGEGNFVRQSKYGFGSASQEVFNAYIVYALSEAGRRDILKEYNHARNEALQSEDPYRLSLVANAALALNIPDEANSLIELVRAQLHQSGFDSIFIDHSITRSYGKSLQVETAALYLMALLNQADTDRFEIRSTVDYLVRSRSHGGFGSTQATILALKALTRYSIWSKHTKSSGNIELMINGQVAGTQFYEAGQTNEIIFDDLERWLESGHNEISIRFSNTKEALPYSFDASWTSLTPESNDEASINLTTELNSSDVKVGETARLHIEIENNRPSGQPMTLAVIGIPAGMSAQPWQLKELQEKGIFDYYEVRKNYLVLYYRQMLPSEVREINIDLKAEVAGNYLAPASTAYLYYTKEHKSWVEGTRIRISR